jgi:hypothetical protein
VSNTLLQRFRIVDSEPFASGGQGSVHHGEDMLTREPVVIKRIAVWDTSTRECARHEIASLRMSRLPGVVRLLAEGVDEDGVFLVMEAVEGQPFPGSRPRQAWSTLRVPTIALLRVLSRVHAVGLVHRDLKPSNVLVGSDGSVVLLDFGIASGRALASRSSYRGTPLYMPPEGRDGVFDATGDLYSVGWMIVEALVGSWVLETRYIPPLPVPAEVDAAVRRMLSDDPALRPRDADEVLTALGERTTVRPNDGSELALRDLFAGWEPFLHEPSRAARALWHVSGGEPARVQATLDAWKREGLVVEVDGRLRPLKLERLEPLPEERHLDALLASGAPWPELGEEALRLAGWLEVDGRPMLALAALDRVLDAMRSRTDVHPYEEHLLLRRSLIALPLEVEVPANQALAALQRGKPPGLRLARVERLLEVMEHIDQGRSAAAWEALAGLPDFAEPEFQVWRLAMALRQALSASPDTAEAFLEAHERWARAVGEHPRWLGWSGLVAYRQGRYEVAADRHARSLEGRQTRGSRMSALRNLAASLLETERLDEVLSAAERLDGEARACGHARYELHAWWMKRAVAYRRGEPLEPDPSVLSAAEAVDRRVAGLLALTEAAAAWRLGRLEESAAIAAVGERMLQSVDRGGFALLCEALRLTAEGAQVAQFEALCHRAVGAGPPLVTAQIFALACAHAPLPAWAEHARTLIGPAVHNSRYRREILSIDEVVGYCWQASPPGTA